VNQYLLADENRKAIAAHNEDLVVTTTKTVGKASYTTHDFNQREEFRQLDAILNAQGPAPDHLHVDDIARAVYASEDDILLRRVRGFLRFGSSYQKTQINGGAVIARPDGTLKITRTPGEYVNLLEENTAEKVHRLQKYNRSVTNQINRTTAAALAKVPEEADRIHEVRSQIHSAVSGIFARQLELLSGED
jgi:hypothetical protein